MCKKEEENIFFQNSSNSLTFPTIPVLTTHLPTFGVHVARSLYNIMLLLFFFPNILFSNTAIVSWAQGHREQDEITFNFCDVTVYFLNRWLGF